MKILAIQSSPRNKGNTAQVLEWVEDELRVLKHDVEDVNVGAADIAPCRACDACKQRPDEPGCQTSDRANDIFASAIAADVIILASPLYCWGVSAQLKALLDRAYCLLKADGSVLISGKRFGLVMTAGDGLEGNLELALPPYRAFVEFFKCHDSGTLLVPLCTKPEALGADVEQRARVFARGLVK